MSHSISTEPPPEALKKTMLTALNPYPLCRFLLAGYIEAMTEADLNNDNRHHVSMKRILLKEAKLIPRFESLFASALSALNLSKEELKRSSEFNLDSYNPSNLESFLGLLRAVIHLEQKGYREIKLLNRPSEADVLCRMIGKQVCAEVKTLRFGRTAVRKLDQWLEDILVEKLKDILPAAKKQISTTEIGHGCKQTILICVINWLDLSAILEQSEYQEVVNQLESGTPGVNHLQGVDTVVFLTYFGESHEFVRRV